MALLVVGVFTLNLMNGELPVGARPPGNDGGPAGPDRTPAPSNVVIPEPEVTFPGSIVYAKAGNIWLQTADEVRQLTDSGPATDSMPSFSPDGEWVYFIRQSSGRGMFERKWYDLATPELLRVRTDESGTVEGIVNGRYRAGSSRWFSWMRQPVMSPDGHTIALVTDAPDPTKSDVVLQLYDTETGKFTKPKLAQTAPLGHQDPAWRPDGKVLLFVKNGRDGTRGAPQILRYTPANGRSSTMTGPGYLAPAWSPDTAWVAATRTDGFGTDVVVLDPAGAEVLRVTNDDHSFSPVWSPAGDAIAFLHIEGRIVDLRMARLDHSSGTWKVVETVPLTDVSGLDAASRPSWFVPPGEMPAATPAPSSAAPSAAPSGPASPAAASPAP